jgi:hypothetical protein
MIREAVFGDISDLGTSPHGILSITSKRTGDSGDAPRVELDMMANPSIPERRK